MERDRDRKRQRDIGRDTDRYIWIYRKIEREIDT